MPQNPSEEKNKENKKQVEQKKEEGPVRGDDVVLIKEKLEETEKKAKEYLNSWKRAKADFINYKRRQNEMFIEMINSASLELILEILPIYDAFSLAINQVPENLRDLEWVKGITQIKFQLGDLLKKKGVEEIKSVGEKFNPEIHEAVEMLESSDKSEGEILEEVQKGYELNGKVIRAAKVKVARK